MKSGEGGGEGGGGRTLLIINYTLDQDTFAPAGPYVYSGHVILITPSGHSYIMFRTLICPLCSGHLFRTHTPSVLCTVAQTSTGV